MATMPPPVNRTTQLQTALATNVADLKTVVKEGRFYSDSIWANQNTAAFLKDMLISILKQVLDLDGSLVAVVHKTSRTLQTLIVSEPIYLELHHFKGFFHH